MVFKTYRHAGTGKVGTYPEALAAQSHGLLKEVKPGAKPLAYTSLSRVSEPFVDQIGASSAPIQTAGSDDETPTVSEASDLDPAPSTTTPRTRNRKAAHL